MTQIRAADLARRREPLPDNAPHILLVDDDSRIRELLCRLLTEQGYRVTPAAEVAAARAAMRSLAFDLILLDVMMPGQSGISFARELKEQSDVPICMLTARSEAVDRIEGLEAGADDYVAKPFEPRELVLRIKNILRRGGPAPGPSDEIRMGEYCFNIGRGE
ncbi:MAG: response regulator, partial [Hyphomicrobiaceae bacterium]